MAPSDTDIRSHVRNDLCSHFQPYLRKNINLNPQQVSARRDAG
jgi:hypothetical protein